MYCRARSLKGTHSQLYEQKGSHAGQAVGRRGNIPVYQNSTSNMEPRSIDTTKILARTETTSAPQGTYNQGYDTIFQGTSVMLMNITFGYSTIFMSNENYTFAQMAHISGPDGPDINKFDLDALVKAAEHNGGVSEWTLLQPTEIDSEDLRYPGFQNILQDQRDELEQNMTTAMRKFVTKDVPGNVAHIYTCKFFRDYNQLMLLTFDITNASVIAEYQKCQYVVDYRRGMGTSTSGGQSAHCDPAATI